MEENGGSRWFLFLSAATVNLLTLSIGTAVSWSSAALEILKGNSDYAENPLGRPIEIEEGSLVASLLPIGAIFSPLLAGALADRIGRKKILLISAISLFLSYLLIAFSIEVWEFYVARFLGGLVLGVVLSVIPVYVAEISQKENRGFYGGFLSLNMTFGKLVVLCIGPYLSVQISGLILLLPIVAFTIIFMFFVPETPYFLTRKGNLDGAKAALEKFRQTSKVDSELSEIGNFVEQTSQIKGGFLNLFKSPALLKTLGLSCAMMFFQQFSGINAILFYLQGIFEASGSSLTSADSGIIIGVVQFLSTFFPPLLVDRLGRRFLILFSCLLTCLSLATLATFFIVRDSGVRVESFAWLPLLSLIVFIMTYNVGLAPIPYIMLGELFPPHVKAAAAAVSISFCCLSTTVTTLLFPFLVEAIGDGETFFCFSACCGIGFIALFFLLPETKGKSLSEIYHSINKENM